MEARRYIGVPTALKTVNTMVEPRLLLRSGFAVSCAGHLAVLTLGLIFAGANPFDSGPPDSIMVDLVSPNEMGRTTEESAVPEATAAVASLPSASALPESAAGSPQSPPQSAMRAAAERDLQQPATPSRPQPTQPAGPPPFPQSVPQPTEPSAADMFGLPLALPDGRLGGGFDAPAIDSAKISADDVTTFREHLKTCLIRPGSVAATDKIRVVLRVALRPDGMLAATPTLIEASASAKGPALMASAINGLRACQPYAMLPADRYKEWQVLDLSFTPQDFAGG
jgi:hypothetical protein